MVMKIAVTSQDHEHVTQHAGHCRWFWIYEVMGREIEAKTLIDLPSSQTFHTISAGVPEDLQDIQVLISGSMGTGLVKRLATFKIEALVTPETDPDTAVVAYLNGTLMVNEPEDQEPGRGTSGHHQQHS